jgi:hypothetical protein
MLMAVFERLAGAAAAFLVVPLLGGLAIWATYGMGRRLAGDAAGIGSAVLLATSPAFAAQLMFPESDVAVTAWWALCLAALIRPGADAAFGSGLAAGAAILTRPNLVPLGLVPGIWLVQGAIGARSRAAVRDVVLFAAGALPACLVVAALNAHWYGSPLVSGYGTLHELFSWEYAAPNLVRYPRWLLQSATPVVLLALAAPLLVPRLPAGGPMRRSGYAVALLSLAFVAAVFSCYLFYLPWEDPGFVRFLLPAFPPLLVLTTASLVALCRALPRRLETVVPMLVVALVAARDGYGAVQKTIALRRSETRYAVAGRYVASRLPPGSVVLSMQHSGSTLYYSGLPTIRYDTIPPANLDKVVDRLTRTGRHPFILLDEGETPVFRERFAAHSPIGRLDWPPLAQLRSPRVVLYDTAPEQVNGDVTPATERMD